MLGLDDEEFRPYYEEVIADCPFGDEYYMHAILGKGVYGAVLKVTKRADGTLYAAKVTELSPDGTLGVTTLREVSLLRGLQHKNIVRLVDCRQSPFRFWMLLEYAAQDLETHLRERSEPLSSAEVKSYSYQMLNGLAFMHSRGTLHRDLKPANMLLFKDDNTVGGHIVKLTDLGLLRSYSCPLRAQTPTVVTMYYRAPEVFIDHTKYHPGLDVWSAAVVVYQLLTRELPWKGTSEMDLIKLMVQTLGAPLASEFEGYTHFKFRTAPNIPTCKHHSLRNKVLIRSKNQVAEELPLAADLLESMFKWDPSDRCLASRSLKHPWMSEVAQELSG